MTPSPGPAVRRPLRSLPAAYPARWEIDAVLSDGGAVHVRPIRPDDSAALVAFHEGLSPETQYFRFFSPKPHLTEADVLRFTSVDYVDRMALVAELHDAIVAVGRYDRVPGTDEAEVAFVVDDRHQGRGLGTLLLEYLAGLARERGIVRFVAETLFGNRRMLSVFRDAGFLETTRVESGTVRVVLDIAPTEDSARAADTREWEADVASVERLLRPGSVAVVGAGRDPSGTGHAVLRKLLTGGFAGPVYPVNPHATEVAGEPAYPTVSAIPGPVDLAVVCVPAGAVPGVVDDCAAAGVRGLVVISSGFAETGAGGVALQRDVVERAHRGGMRLIGPNCIGVVNTDPRVRLDATFAPARPVPGRIGFASQSGALGIAMLERARSKGLGLSTFVSMGNKADVSGNDVLRFWERDPGTDVVLLYLESFGNPRAFSRVARRVSRSKPVVAVKSGRSASGVRGARSHTAAMASPDTAVDALFLQTGVIRVDTLEQLFDVGDVLAHQPLPRGDRAAVVGNAGGAAILAADALEAAGLVVPELTPTTQAAIRAACPSAAGTSNPVDLGAAASPEAFAATVRAVLADEGVDALLVVHAPVPQVSSEEIGAAVRAASAGDRPVVAVFLAMDRPPASVDAEGGRVPAFAFPEPAAQALARVEAYARWRERPEGVAPALPGIDHDTAAAVVAEALRRSPQGAWLDAPEAATLLGAYGIPVATTVRVSTAVEAVAAAAAVGFPVALKVASGSFVHKTDVGGVRLGLADAGAVRAAFEDMAERIGDGMGDAVVQPMLSPGVETIVGVVNDALFGPLVMFGSGGVAAEVFGDRAFRVLPLTDLDAHELVRSTRGSPLLFGHRGAPAADVAGLEDLLLRAGRLAEGFPELAEMDLNPVIVSAEGTVAVDAKVRVAPHTPHPELQVRRLRGAGG